MRCAVRRVDRGAEATAFHDPELASDEAVAPSLRCRPCELAVDSVDHCHFVVPDLKQGERFYTDFGLDVQKECNGLGLYTERATHRCGRVAEGSAKKLTHMSSGGFPEDVDGSRARPREFDVQRLNPPPEHSVHFVPSAIPECLAPHAWLADGTSLYDHFGAGYTLLVTNGRADGVELFRRAAEWRNRPLTVLAPHDDRLPERYAAGYALIRPDQHVAWRADALPEDAGALLDRVAGHA